MFQRMSPFWSPKEDDSPEVKKVDFGPRLKYGKSKADGTKENSAKGTNGSESCTISQSSSPKEIASGNRASAATSRRGSADQISSEQISSNLLMKLDIANNKIAELERDRDEWKRKAESAILAQSEGNLGDMLVEIELETLRDEVDRLRSLASPGAHPNDNTEVSSLRLRCVELETQVSNLKREKAVLEKKNKEDKNAEIHKIRTLQEQISNEKRLRERIANTESALPVVTVGGSQSVITGAEHQLQGPSVMTIKPRSQSPLVPSFVVGSAKRSPVIDPYNLDQTTAVLPSMKPPQPSSVSAPATVGYDALGDDAIADQWRKCLADRPESYRALVSRQVGTNIFHFGTYLIACKKIGNHAMIQMGRETMLLEKFLDMHGPPVNSPKSSSGAVNKLMAGSTSVTLKSITASRSALISKQSSN